MFRIPGLLGGVSGPLPLRVYLMATADFGRFESHARRPRAVERGASKIEVAGTSRATTRTRWQWFNMTGNRCKRPTPIPERVRSLSEIVRNGLPRGGERGARGAFSRTPALHACFVMNLM